MRDRKWYGTFWYGTETKYRIGRECEKHGAKMKVA